MAEAPASALQRAEFYEAHQEWPADVSREIAAHLRSAAPRARSAVFLGCATGVNDALPFARSAPDVRVIASDVDPDFLRALSARTNGLANLEVRRVDVRTDLATLPEVDLAAMLFVIHRLDDWKAVVPGLARLLRPGGRFFTSEFAGPSGIIYLSNENGGTGDDPVSRLLRRCRELRPTPFARGLKSTYIRPFLDALRPDLVPVGQRDFRWAQSVTVAEMHRKIETGAYAPFFGLERDEKLLGRLRDEFLGEWSRRVDLVETIRVHEFRRV